MPSRTASGSFFQGVSKLKLYFLRNASATTRALFEVLKLPHERTAPSVSDFSGSTKFSGANSKIWPRPLHSGHIPIGELKLNIGGDSSGNDSPQWAQAFCSDISNSPPPITLTITAP